MKNASVLLAAGLLVPALMPLQGCTLAAAAAGAGAAYLYGKTERAEVEATPEEVIAAAEAVATDMGLTLESSEATALDGKLLAETATDTRVKVTAEAREDGSTLVIVRVGVADEEAAGRILEGIVERL